MIHVSDWLPTLLSVAGYDMNKENLKHLDGMNMWPTLKDSVPSPRKEILITIDPLLYNNSALRVDNWKLVNDSKYQKCKSC